MRRYALALLAAALFTAAGCGGGAQQSSSAPASAPAPAVRAEGQTMGTFYQITIPGDYEGGSAQLKADAEEQFKAVTSVISSFDKQSEISRFNARTTDQPMQVSTYLAHVIEEVNRQAKRIGGAVELSIAPLVNLWGFGPDGRPNRVPTDEEIAAAREYVGTGAYGVRYSGGGAFLMKKDPRVKLDLSTVGEGLGVDKLADFLDAKGVPSYLAAIAGAIRTKGTNPDGKEWRVGIVNPLQPDGQPFAVVCPQGMAMSTSGSYRNYFVDEKTGERYSHIIDPATGRPIKHHTVSVTVIGRSALETDTLDTGLMVMGSEKAHEWADATETPIYTIDIVDGKPVGKANRYFEQYLKCSTQDAKQ